MARYRVMKGYGPISLRRSADPKHPLYEEWHTWNDGDVFVPPPNLKTIGGLSIAECVKRGVLEEVKGNG